MVYDSKGFQVGFKDFHRSFYGPFLIQEVETTKDCVSPVFTFTLTLRSDI